MAVAPASMADKIIVLDDEEETPEPSSAASNSPHGHRDKKVSLLKAQQPTPTHITQSPFATAKKNTHVLEAENQRLFAEFVEHCTPLTQDCPEVLTFLQTKHAKVSPDFLSSVEFRNTLGRCLTRVQGNRSKMFVYINELCTVLKQHAAKKRQSFTRVEPSTSKPDTSLSTSAIPKSKDEAEHEQPSTSGLQENNNQEAERKAKRASRKQIAYLENLLKMYNDEICRLQQAELSLDDLGAEDSLYIQEHKLKRKIMKIFEKLCELKGYDTRTGRVIEQRISYKGTRYPEINKKIERFINSPEAHKNPPDYQDILQQVQRANERHNLCLSRKQLNEYAKEAFTETGRRMQERRHLDMVYNFGSHLTDSYKLSADPAQDDPSLQRKLRSNREMAVSRLDEVIAKYAVKQEDTEEEERCKRLKKDNKEKEGCKSDKLGVKEVNGKKEEQKEENEEEEEEEDDEEEDESSDPDIEEEIQASTQHDGADDDDDDEEDDTNEAEQAEDAADKDQTVGLSESASAGDEGSSKGDDEVATSGLSPHSDGSNQMSPLSEGPPSTDSPSQSEPMQTDDQKPLSNGNVAGLEEPMDSSSYVSPADVPPTVTNGSTAPSPEAITQTNHRTTPPPSPRTTRSQKRKREERSPKHVLIHDSSDVEIPLDMGVISCNSPQVFARAETPTQDLVSSSQTTPPPTGNKVNVATQCDPDEIIVLSDSE